MIAKAFSKNAIEKHGNTLTPLRHSFGDLSIQTVTFQELKNNFTLYRNKVLS